MNDAHPNHEIWLFLLKPLGAAPAAPIGGAGRPAAMVLVAGVPI
jgi:hypothetical protein